MRITTLFKKMINDNKTLINKNYVSIYSGNNYKYIAFNIDRDKFYIHIQTIKTIFKYENRVINYHNLDATIDNFKFYDFFNYLPLVVIAQISIKDYMFYFYGIDKKIMMDGKFIKDLYSKTVQLDLLDWLENNKRNNLVPYTYTAQLSKIKFIEMKGRSYKLSNGEGILINILDKCESYN